MYQVLEKDSKIDILVFYETSVQMLLKSKIFPGQVLSKRNDKKLMKHVINILASVIYCHSSYLDQKFLHFKLIFLLLRLASVLLSNVIVYSVQLLQISQLVNKTLSTPQDNIKLILIMITQLS